MSALLLNLSGTATLYNQYGFSDSDGNELTLEQWNAATEEERFKWLHDSFANDIMNDLDHNDIIRNIASDIISTANAEDSNGNKFSLQEVAKMNSSDLILRGIVERME
jgi:hypothetical protein